MNKHIFVCFGFVLYFVFLIIYLDKESLMTIIRERHLRNKLVIIHSGHPILLFAIDIL